MSRAVPVHAICLVAAVLICPFSVAQSGRDLHSAPPALDVIVERMQQVTEATQYEPLRVTREYLLTNGTSGEVISHVLAQLDYDEAGAKKYSIRETSGSGRGE